MVFVLDEGSVFDEPVDKIWRFMREGREFHKHGNRGDTQVEVQGNSIVLTFEAQGPSGKTTIKMKSTEVAPLGRIMEYLQGPLAGSRAIVYYVPLGNKTGITVVGEYVSKVIPEDQIRSMVLSQAERSFNEDVENLKQFK